jgi:DNA-binding transcriptional regulator LsrR (DeoR family)
LNHHTE